VTYPGTVSLSAAPLTDLAGLLRAHRRSIGSRWRKLLALIAQATGAPGGGGLTTA
jgi:hypothetical protein